MNMTQDHWPPGLNIVKVTISIFVIEIGPTGIVDEDGIAAEKNGDQRGNWRLL